MELVSCWHSSRMNKYFNMFNLDKFISDCVTYRFVSLFGLDMEANMEKLTVEN